MNDWGQYIGRYTCLSHRGHTPGALDSMWLKLGLICSSTRSGQEGFGKGDFVDSSGDNIATGAWEPMVLGLLYDHREWAVASESLRVAG